MTREQLVNQYVQQGIQNRLRDIQRELGVLKEHFPHLVAAFTNAAVVAPPAPNGAVPEPAAAVEQWPKLRMSRDRRLQQMTKYLTAHPGSSTTDMADGLNVTSNHVLSLVRDIARGKKHGAKQPMTWTLRAKKVS